VKFVKHDEITTFMLLFPYVTQRYRGVSFHQNS